MGKFEVTKARIHDDLLQEGLKKKPSKSAASFVTIGEPDIVLHSVTAREERPKQSPAKKGIASPSARNEITVEIKGLDIYDPIKDEVNPAMFTTSLTGWWMMIMTEAILS